MCWYYNYWLGISGDISPPTKSSVSVRTSIRYRYLQPATMCPLPSSQSANRSAVYQCTCDLPSRRHGRFELRFNASHLSPSLCSPHGTSSALGTSIDRRQEFRHRRNSAGILLSLQHGKNCLSVQGQACMPFSRRGDTGSMGETWGNMEMR